MLVQMLVVTLYHRAAGETQIALLVVLIVKSLLGWNIINVYQFFRVFQTSLSDNILLFRIWIHNILIILLVWLHYICDASTQWANSCWYQRVFIWHGTPYKLYKYKEDVCIEHFSTILEKIRKIRKTRIR